MLHPLAEWKGCRVDLLQPAAEAGQGAKVCFYRGVTEILQQVVVQVDTVHAGMAGKDLVQIAEVIVDKMGEWLRWVHAWSWRALSTSDA